MPEQAAGIIKIFHEIGVATGADIGDDRHLAAGRIEIIQRNIMPGASVPWPADE